MSSAIDAALRGVPRRSTLQGPSCSISTTAGHLHPNGQKLMKALVATLLLLAPVGLAARSTKHEGTESSERIRTLNNVAASTRLPGPPIWEFTRDGKKIVVLGTLSYLPRNVMFDSARIEQEISRSQALVSPPGLVVGDNISFFRGLTLWRGIRRSKLNPEGKTLNEVLPPALYTKWQKAEGAFPGITSSSGRLRPIYAAFEVFESATGRAKLDANSPAISLVNSVARRQGLESVDARLRLPIANPKETVKGFDIPPADDIQCLEQTLDRLSTFIEQAPELGDAWATGDMGQLQHWANDSVSMSFCWSSLTNEAIAHQQGIIDLQEKVDERWMAETRKTLATHDTIFTTMSLRELFEADGLGAKLRGAGFEMVSPD
jgi:hypothetical protein